MIKSNADIARRVYRALKTPSDDNPRTDPILAFHFKGKSDYIMLRCNKNPEISIKGKDEAIDVYRVLGSEQSVIEVGLSQ